MQFGGDIAAHQVEHHLEPEYLAAYLFDPRRRLGSVSRLHFLQSGQQVTGKYRQSAFYRSWGRHSCRASH